MKIRKKFLSLLLAAGLAIGLAPVPALAQGGVTRTTTLDLTDEAFQTDQKNEDEGWSWDAGTSTLTLDNVNFETGSGACIKPFEDRSVNLKLVGANRLKSDGTAIGVTQVLKSHTMTISGDSLVIESSSGAPSAQLMNICNLVLESGNVTLTKGGITAVESVKVKGGSLSIDARGASGFGAYPIYACASLEISGGTVDFQADDFAVFITGTSHPDPKIGLKITGGDVTMKGGQAAAFVGNDPACPKDIYIKTKGTIDIKDAPIGFYAANGDITVLAASITAATDKIFAKSSGNTDGVIATIADYEAVDQAIAKAEKLNKDHYKDFSAVEAALSAVVRDLDYSHWEEVNDFAKAIEAAVADLAYKDADYSQVDQAIAKANRLNREDYKSFSPVDKAVKAVKRGKNILEQKKVDRYAAAIEEAIAGLVYKDADYSRVDQAIAKAKKLNKGDYKDFSAVEAAIAAVERGKNITEQETVDGYAAAIGEAIAGLEKVAPRPTQTPKPAETEKPSESGKPTETEKPSESAKPTETEKPSGSAGPEETKKPSESAKPTESAKPSESAKPTESAKPSESAGPTKTKRPEDRSPKTGESQLWVLWLVILVVSTAGAAVAAAVYWKKKKAE